MALNLLTSHPLFNPPPSLLPLLQPPPPSPTSIHFSRWNNPNFDAHDPALRRRRRIADIESDLRRRRRFSSALTITSPSTPSTPSPTPTKSRGSPSHPSSPSLPGRHSKYSKPPQNPIPSHPAFTRIARARTKTQIPDPGEEVETSTGIRITDTGVTYKLEGAPFEFQYSYTEAPRVRPLALREPPFLPFGPEYTPRPWTGRKPLPKSKKELPEFDSFKLPPHGKKGVKPVQSPGPFLAGMEPNYRTTSREEVLGEPLTKEEIADLVKGSLKTRRQLNIGRDGLTHNMLENIHAHWKRKRVCKIKCKGVCTVDMDNVCRQLEEKVGGKVIFRNGGVIFLFRGRNYNYRTRPRFPLMLWKPVTPVYPRLVKQAPEGLTLEEAKEMRKRGCQLLPICKLGKNGVYTNLVQQVREAFEACDLVRVNCSGLNKSDCRKIGAKLQDLVPCVLLSFVFEHILMWRGKDWKSALPPLKENIVEAASDQTASIGNGHFLSNQVLDSGIGQSSNQVVSIEMPLESGNLDQGTEKLNDPLKPDSANDMLASPATPVTRLSSSVDMIGNEPSAAIQIELSALGAEKDLEDPSLKLSCQSIPSYQSENTELDEDPYDQGRGSELSAANCMGPSTVERSDVIDELETTVESIAELEIESRESIKSDDTIKCMMSSYMEGVVLLLKHAIDSGSALVLDEDESFDADVVYQKSVAFAKIAPRGPVFQHKPRKVSVRRNEGEKHVKLNEQRRESKVSSHTEKKANTNRGLRIRKRDDAQEFFSDVVPQGTLRVDELAKLLA